MCIRILKKLYTPRTKTLHPKLYKGQFSSKIPKSDLISKSFGILGASKQWLKMITLTIPKKIPFPSSKEHNYEIRTNQTSSNLIKFILNSISAYISKTSNVYPYT